MIATVLIVCEAAFAFGAAGMLVAGRRAAPDIRRERGLKFLTYFMIVHAMLLAGLAGKAAIVALCAAIWAGGAFELYRLPPAAVASTPPRSRRLGIGTAYALVGTAGLVFVATSPPGRIVFVYLSVALFDGFSQVTGQLAGRHALAPRTSPNKTIEGALGGAAAAVIGAALLRGVAGLGVGGAAASALLLSAAALSGDLLASRVKRIHGVKNYGGILPGHGGVLDRFDGFLAAAAVSAFVLRMV
jgi:phosphatidate cytidylyltransferase